MIQLSEEFIKKGKARKTGSIFYDWTLKMLSKQNPVTFYISRYDLSDGEENAKLSNNNNFFLYFPFGDQEVCLVYNNFVLTKSFRDFEELVRKDIRKFLGIH